MDATEDVTLQEPDALATGMQAVGQTLLSFLDDEEEMSDQEDMERPDEDVEEEPEPEEPIVVESESAS